MAGLHRGHDVPVEHHIVSTVGESGLELSLSYHERPGQASLFEIEGRLRLWNLLYYYIYMEGRLETR